MFNAISERLQSGLNRLSSFTEKAVDRQPPQRITLLKNAALVTSFVSLIGAWYRSSLLLGTVSLLSGYVWNKAHNTNARANSRALTLRLELSLLKSETLADFPKKGEVAKQKAHLLKIQAFYKSNKSELAHYKTAIDTMFAAIKQADIDAFRSVSLRDNIDRNSIWSVLFKADTGKWPDEVGAKVVGSPEIHSMSWSETEQTFVMDPPSSSSSSKREAPKTAPKAQPKAPASRTVPTSDRQEQLKKQLLEKEAQLKQETDKILEVYRSLQIEAGSIAFAARGLAEKMANNSLPYLDLPEVQTWFRDNIIYPPFDVSKITPRGVYDAAVKSIKAHFQAQGIDISRKPQQAAISSTTSRSVPQARGLASRRTEQLTSGV